MTPDTPGFNHLAKLPNEVISEILITWIDEYWLEKDEGIVYRDECCGQKPQCYLSMICHHIQGNRPLYSSAVAAYNHRIGQRHRTGVQMGARLFSIEPSLPTKYRRRLGTVGRRREAPDESYIRRRPSRHLRCYGSHGDVVAPDESVHVVVSTLRSWQSRR